MCHHAPLSRSQTFFSELDRVELLRLVACARILSLFFFASSWTKCDEICAIFGFKIAFFVDYRYYSRFSLLFIFNIFFFALYFARWSILLQKLKYGKLIFFYVDPSLVYGWRWDYLLSVEMFVAARAVIISSIDVLASSRSNLSRKRDRVYSIGVTLSQAEMKALYLISNY